MTEEEPQSTPVEPEQSSRPRNPDGTFMSQTQINRIREENKKLKAEAKDHLIEQNKALMQGTHFNEDYFKGMPPFQVNQFLQNYHKQVAEQKAEPGNAPNTPIIGTPVGSGRPRRNIDNFINIDPKARVIEFEAPASVVLRKVKNKEEAEKYWLDQR